MCGQWGEHGMTKAQSRANTAQEMSLEELKKVIDDVAFFKPNITLFGGEPLLHRHAVDLIDYIKNKDLHCLMITNGSLLNTHGGKLIESGIDELNVSIDGAGQLHDKIRGMAGLYDKISAGLKEIASLKKEKKIKKPLINLQCTINRYNYTFLDQMLDVAKEVQADSITFHHLIFVSRDMIEQQKAFDIRLQCSSTNWEGFVFEPGIQPDVLHRKIKGIKNERNGFPIDFYPNFSLQELREYYENPDYLSQNSAARCVSPWMTSYIFPDGALRPCLNLDYSFGNVKAEPFPQLWNSDSAIRFRSILKEQRLFPACARCTELYRY
jgi:radical SAM protein with 4Fe4S-binding SPASM domain